MSDDFLAAVDAAGGRLTFTGVDLAEVAKAVLPKPALKPTKGQQEALDLIHMLGGSLAAPGDVAVISGPAGTGKTSLLRLVDNEQRGRFVLTPTGKAASRVKVASGLDAQTIHKWQYHPEEDPLTGKVSFFRQHVADLRLPPDDVLLVDESSMISKDVWMDLHGFATELGLRVVLIGDGFQLPPVETDFTKKAFSVFADDFPATYRVNLTEVLRQALESPIIRTVTGIRLGANINDALAEWETGEDLNDLAMKTWKEGGAIIVHRNATRQDLNRKMRALQGLRPDRLGTGEPLLVMKNDYEADVFNGEVHTADEVEYIGEAICVDRYNGISFEASFSWVRSGEREFTVCNEEIFGKLPDKFWHGALYRGARLACLEARLDYRPFVQTNMGYVLTCHKSQGSEWPSVLVVVEPSLRMGGPEGRRWIYTALTRARETLRVTFL